MSELPEGWTNTTLGEICSKPQYGWTSKASRHGRIKYVRTTDISNGQINWDDVPFCKLEPDDVDKFRVREDDILVSRAGSVGVSFRIKDVPYNAVFASYLIRFNPLECVLPKYVEYFLNTDDYWRAISEVSAGIAVPNVNASKLAELELTLPPINEQRRIVAKLEKLLSRVDAAQARLATIPRILKRFRQSVLAAACSGRLTTDWREQNTSDDNSRTLISRLFDKRRAFWEEREWSKLAGGGRTPDNNNWKKRYKPPFEPSSEEQPEFPANWSIATVSQLALLDVGFAFKSAEYSKDGIRLLRGENVEPGSLRWNDVRFWSESNLKGYEHLLIEEGEIILAMDRPVISTGLKIARAKRSDSPCLLVQRMTRFKMVDERMTDYLYYNLQLNNFIEHLSVGMTGSDLPHVTGDGLARYTIGLPPIEEQQEIVRRVEALFKTADALEARYRKAKAHVDKLTQSILARAFRGELVTTEAELARQEGRTYEPASVLLERIRQEREQQQKTVKSKTKRAPRSKKDTATKKMFA